MVLRSTLLPFLAILLAACTSSSPRAVSSTIPPPPERTEDATAEQREAASQRSSGGERGDEEQREAPSDAEELARAVAGEWRLADRDAEAQIDRAVSRVTDQMGFLSRGIANERIDEAVNPDERVTIEADGDRHIVVAIGPGDPVRLALDGGEVRTTGADGSPLRMRAMVRRGQLTIVENNEQGRRVLYFQPRGDALVVSTRIQSERLPADIVYQLDYQRSGGEGVASR